MSFSSESFSPNLGHIAIACWCFSDTFLCGVSFFFFFFFFFHVPVVKKFRSLRFRQRNSPYAPPSLSPPHSHRRAPARPPHPHGFQHAADMRFEQEQRARRRRLGIRDTHPPPKPIYRQRQLSARQRADMDEQKWKKQMAMIPGNNAPLRA